MLLGQEGSDCHVGGVFHIVQDTALGLHLQLHALKERVGAGKGHFYPPAHHRAACGGEGVLCGLTVGADQAPGPQEDSAKIAGHHTAHILDLFPLKDVEHRLTSGALGLPIVGIALRAGGMEAVAPAVMAGIVVLLFYRFNAGAGLFLRGYRENMSDKT